MRPIDIKNVAKIFADKYYPKWLSRVDRIWDMFENFDYDASTSYSKDNHTQLDDAFEISGETDQEFKEFISGIAILAFTYQGSKENFSISPSEIRNKVSIVSNPKIPHNLQKKLESVLEEMFPLLSQQSNQKIKNHDDNFRRNVDVNDLCKKKEFNLLEIGKSYFEAKHYFALYLGTKGQAGKLFIDKSIEINLPKTHNQICEKLYNELSKTWDSADPIDIGWVSYDEFREFVSTWDVTTNETIINSINRLNIAIRIKINIDKDLIENGKPFLREGHYRFRINVGHIDMVS